MTPAGFPHSDTPGSTLGCQLPRAYRRLLRPSSALDAKASTMCPSQLVTHTTNPHHHHNPNPANSHSRTPDHNRRKRQAMHTTRHKRTNTPPPQSPQGHATTNKQPHHPSTGQRGCKMLASTIQISNNNPTPPHHPPPRGGQAGMAGNESPAAPPGRRLAPTPHARLILQNPNSVSANPPPPHTHAHTHAHTRCAVRAAQRGGWFVLPHL